MLRILSLVAVLALGSVASAETPWKVGFAKVTITPEQPMWMSGYASRTAPAEGTETDLWAKAAVLDDARGQRLVLVTLDLVGIDRDMATTICASLKKHLNLNRDQVALSCSHTHCGPVVGHNLGSMYFLDAEQTRRVREYSTRLPERILAAVTQAVAAVQPVSLDWAVGKTDFAVNRRTNKEADVPALRTQGTLKGPVDHDVPVLVARTAKGTVTGIIFGYACHATTLSFQKWCGDYPGFAMIELERQHPGAVAMFVAGCGADQNPLPRRTVDLARGYGHKLAQAVMDVIRQPGKSVGPSARTVYQEIELPLHEIPSRDALVQESLGSDKYKAARAKMLMKKLEITGSIPATVPYPIQTWQLGELTLFWLAGEVVVDYALRIKRELGPATWVLGYANDVMAYIPSERVLKEGGYEGGGAMVYYGLPSVWATGVENRMMTEVQRQARIVRPK